MLEKNRRREEKLGLEAELCSLSGKPIVKEKAPWRPHCSLAVSIKGANRKNSLSECSDRT